MLIKELPLVLHVQLDITAQLLILVQFYVQINTIHLQQGKHNAHCVRLATVAQKLRQLLVVLALIHTQVTLHVDIAQEVSHAHQHQYHQQDAVMDIIQLIT